MVSFFADSDERSSPEFDSNADNPDIRA